ncbi:hypothetical protein CH063_03492 [Colletotrichum higginsianum]|uniref:Uncharacterized protein n=1 Tax=Colletotrichum higginsianum (strain IMI 349063) TaxID=759273 RepID=H1VXT5_COLHI|nr:hypothetical protein CH063_03492 [Colletotrichum higginsianum]
MDSLWSATRPRDRTLSRQSSGNPRWNVVKLFLEPLWTTCVKLQPSRPVSVVRAFCPPETDFTSSYRPNSTRNLFEAVAYEILSLDVLVRREFHLQTWFFTQLS